MAQDVWFAGIASPARLDDAEAVLVLLPDVVFGWPFHIARADPSQSPFYTITGDGSGQRFQCQSLVWNAAPRPLDALNAVCDLVAAVAHVLPEADPALICLHAAAVRVSGRLLVFPNVRKAGKSTLSVALAMAGHQLVGDDVVPLSFQAEGGALAHALGIAPRLRLPLPASAPHALRAAVDAADGISNRQYRYLRLQDQPVRGEVLPVDAFVILDRSEAPVAASIVPVLADQAMDVLLHQNFTRSRHSGDILAAITAMLEAVPVFRLTYFDLDGAIHCLEGAFPETPGARPRDPQPAAQPFRLADFRRRRAAAVTGDTSLRQRAGTVMRRIGETLYLADAEGRAIHRADPLSEVIWTLLAEPATPGDLLAILREAFPGVAEAQIADDLSKLLRKWAKAGLIEAALA